METDNERVQGLRFGLECSPEMAVSAVGNDFKGATSGGASVGVVGAAGGGGEVLVILWPASHGMAGTMTPRTNKLPATV